MIVCGGMFEPAQWVMSSSEQGRLKKLSEIFSLHDAPSNKFHSITVILSKVVATLAFFLTMALIYQMNVRQKTLRTTISTQALASIWT